MVGILAPGHIPDSVLVLKRALDEERICSSGVVIQSGDLSAYRYRSKDSDLVAVDRLEPYKSLQHSAHPLLYTQPGQGQSQGTLPLVPLTDSVESVFFEAHSHIRDIDGLHADEALDEPLQDPLCQAL